MRIRYANPWVQKAVVRVIKRALEEQLAPLVIPGSVEVVFVPGLEVSATARNFFGKRCIVDVGRVLARL